jgi:hypothetical protein
MDYELLSKEEMYSKTGNSDKCVALTQSILLIKLLPKILKSIDDKNW